MDELKPGTKVRLRDNPARKGVIGAGTEGSGRRLRLQVFLMDGTEDHFPPSAGITMVWAYGWDLGGFPKKILEVCLVILFTVIIFTDLRRSGIIAFES